MSVIEDQYGKELRSHVDRELESQLSLYRLKKHFGTPICELLPGNQSVPRVLAHICQSILEHGLNSSDILSRPADTQTYYNYRLQFNRGHFIECTDVATLMMLLRNFLRELPEPLVPFPFYYRALDIVREHLASLEREAQQYAKGFLSNHSQSILLSRAIDDMDVMFSHLWQPDLQQAETKALLDAVRRFAFTIRARPQELELLWASLPKAHRNALKFLGVFFARLALNSNMNGATLARIASHFGRYIVRPEIWPDNDVKTTNAVHYLEQKFVLLLLFFIKKKHILITSTEQAELEQPHEEFMSGLLESVFPDIAPHVNIHRSLPQVTKYRVSSTQRIVLENLNLPVSKLSLKAPLRRGASTRSASSPQRSVVVANESAPRSPFRLDDPPSLAPAETDRSPSAVPASVEELLEQFLSSVRQLRSTNTLPAAQVVVPKDAQLSASACTAVSSGAPRSQARTAIPPAVHVNWTQHLPQFLRASPLCARWTNEPAFASLSSVMRALSYAHQSMLVRQLSKWSGVEASNVNPGRALLHLLRKAGVRPSSGSAPPTRGVRRSLLPKTVAESHEEVETPIRPTNPDALLNFPVALIANVETTTRQESQFVFDETPGFLNMQSPPFLHRGDSCENCLTKFALTRRRYHCQYCGRLLCADCCTQLTPLPSKILQECDFSEHPACDACEEHLRHHHDAPMLAFETMSEKAVLGFGKGKVEAVRDTRARLLFLIYFYLPGCLASSFLLALLPGCIRPFLLDSPRISMNSLALLQQGKFHDYLVDALQLIRRHIAECPQCCNHKRYCCSGEHCSRAKGGEARPLDGRSMADVRMCVRCRHFAHRECRNDHKLCTMCSMRTVAQS
eukprot:TRINITY_DN9560_c0_g1_i1.p1 TRINITY_DN9560_c0_g1~~TRINITY_DN9560_c0_g1_i1.p1  ORF type:complete len:853 (-),score=87.52 TRINITY_DN9560_c0_g1_i1:1710-4268(-)